jgi:hypothetical protein
MDKYMLCVGATRQTPAGEPTSPSTVDTVQQRLTAFLDAQFLPIGLLATSVVGALYPSPGHLTTQRYPKAIYAQLNASTTLRIHAIGVCHWHSVML